VLAEQQVLRGGLTEALPETPVLAGADVENGNVQLGCPHQDCGAAGRSALNG
jgi:hypothetical protein